jgi:hypothetical protein
VTIHHDRIKPYQIGRIPFDTTRGMPRNEAASLVESSRQMVETYLERDGRFAFHTHNFNLNSEEESFLRICHDNRLAAISKRKVTFRREGALGSVDKVRSVWISHAFLNQRNSGHRYIYFDPTSRAVWESYIPEDDLSEKNALSKWIFLRGDCSDYHAYDEAFGTKIKIDELSYNFFLELKKGSDLPQAQSTLSSLVGRDIPWSAIKAIVTNAEKCGILKMQAKKERMRDGQEPNFHV